MNRLSDKVAKRVAKRRRAARRFRLYGLCAVVLSGLFLVFFFFDMFRKGVSALRQAEVLVEIRYDEKSAATAENVSGTA